MPFIAKDGTIFGSASGGGGNSTSVDITYADYLALGDKVNSDGIDYYIIDPPEEQSFPENCKVRYIDDPNNENYDWLQINFNGEWVNWKFVGQDTYWLYHAGVNYGEFEMSTQSGSNGWGYGNLRLDESLTVGIVNPPSAGAKLNTYTKNKIDFSNKSKLIANYKCTATASDNYNLINVYIVRELNFNSAGDVVTSSQITSCNLFSTGTIKEGVLNLDVSSVSDEAYIVIHIMNNVSGGTIQVTFTDMYLE